MTSTCTSCALVNLRMIKAPSRALQRTQSKMVITRRLQNLLMLNLNPRRLLSRQLKLGFSCGFCVEDFVSARL